jgi:hypothetical protein
MFVRFAGAAFVLFVMSITTHPAAVAQESPAASQPQVAGAAEGDVSVLPEPDIELRYIGSRLFNVLYWKIGADGRGEVSTPQVGFATDLEHNSDFRYLFQAGVHRFNIGPNGYAAMRELMAEVLDGTIDQSALHEAVSADVVALCPQLRELDDTPSMQLRWNGASHGAFIVPNACLSAQGRELSERIASSWRVLGRHMLHSGQPGVIEEVPAPLSVPAPLPPPIPLTLDYHQRNVWTGSELRWHLETDGTGWLELSEGENMHLADPPAPEPWTVYIPKGRHAFNLGASGYANIRNTLEPYISGPQRNADCDGMSDQPLVTLTASNPARAIRGQASTDLGCQDFAQRAGAAERVILSALAAERAGEQVP